MSFTPVNPRHLSIAYLQQRSALGDTPLTTNSIAPRADSMPASGSKCLKNRAITSQKIKNHENPKPNRPVAGIDTAQGAIQLIVNDALLNEKGKGYKSYLRLRIEANQAVLVKASDYQTEPNPFQPWDFDPNTFAAGADSAMYEKGGKTFVVYLQEAAAAGSKLVLNIAGEIGTPQDEISITTNSIALCAVNTPAKCQKRFHNRRKTSQKTQKIKSCEKSKRNRLIAGMESARGAIELAVNGQGVSA